MRQVVGTVSAHIPRAVRERFKDLTNPKGTYYRVIKKMLAAYNRAITIPEDTAKKIIDVVDACS